MTEELDAILFDAGGTLFHLNPTKEEIVARMLRTCGFEADPELLARAMAKAERALAKIHLVRVARLSVMPLEKAEFDRIVDMGGGKIRL